MSAAKKYRAAPIPRFLRQTKLGYLPLNCIIGSRLVTGDGGANLYFDIVMLPVKEFQRMRTNVGLQHIFAPELKGGPTFSPAFVLADVKEVVVPEREIDPENFARNHFLKLFGLIASDEQVKPLQAKDLPPQVFSGAAGECTKTDK